MDDIAIVRGGMSDLPPAGQVFSGSYGRTVEEAAAYVPHGQIRATSVGQIGGSVDVVPEVTRLMTTMSMSVSVWAHAGSGR